MSNIDKNSKWVKTVGVDIDFHIKDKKQRKGLIDARRARCLLYGELIKDKPSSSNGHHFKIKLKEPCTFKKSIAIRDSCGDDRARMYYDIRRFWHDDLEAIDILFDWRVYNK